MEKIKRKKAKTNFGNEPTNVARNQQKAKKKIAGVNMDINNAGFRIVLKNWLCKGFL